MINKDTKILVCVSGGVDSVYLLHYLIDQGFTNLGIAHFNHNIREKITNEIDNEMAKGYARQLDLPFSYRSMDVPDYCEKNKVSIEVGARTLRYEFFNSLDYDVIALGHHADDQAETVLYNATRGAGVHGLAGMKEYDEESKIYRPLLSMSKEEIYEKAHELELQWNEDSTNQETIYDRCLIRNEIIPKLEERRAGTSKVLVRQAAYFAELSDFLKYEAKIWMDSYVYDNTYPREYFVDEHPILQGEVLRALWIEANGETKGFNHKVHHEVVKWLSSVPEGGSSVYFGKKRLSIRNNKFFILEEE